MVETMHDLPPFGEMVDLLVGVEGYREGAPGGGAISAWECDSAVCAQSRCGNCGHEGMEYRPFVRKGSYRAFAVCPCCGYWEEF